MWKTRHSSILDDAATDEVRLTSIQRDSVEDSEQVHEATAESDDSAVYRKLYAVLSLMTLALLTINIVQVCLLTKISNLIWIVVFPLAVFGAFMIWAGAIVLVNLEKFRIKDSHKAEDAAHHLRRLFSLRAHPWGGKQPIWPRRSARVGILATILLNIILVEFIYLPIFALPSFKSIKWETSLAVTRPKTPAVAVIQNFNYTQSERAILPSDNWIWQEVCDEDRSEFGDCVSNHITTFQGQQERPGPVVQLRYAVYTGDEEFTQYLGLGFTLFYPFTQVAFFDPTLLDVLPIAWQCGLLGSVQLLTANTQQVVLTPISIIDELNASNRQGICSNDAFNKYTSYTAAITDWGPQFSEAEWQGCGVEYSSNPNDAEFCVGKFQFVFLSSTNALYESKHGAGWVDILTAEGGVVGFVTFVTWFLGIFAT